MDFLTQAEIRKVKVVIAANVKEADEKLIKVENKTSVVHAMAFTS